MPSVSFPLKAGQPDVEFKFTIKAARDLERLAGCNYQTLLSRGQQIEAIVMMTCFGLRHADKAMTVDRATDLVDAYVEADGDIVQLFNALQEAMNQSGVYGPKRSKPAKDGDEGSANPQTEAA